MTRFIPILLLLVAAPAQAKPTLRIAFGDEVAAWVDPISVKVTARPLFDELAGSAGYSYSLAFLRGPELQRRIEAGTIDLGFASLSDFIEVSRRSEVKPLVTGLTLGRKWFKLLLLVREGTFGSLKQLKDRTISTYRGERVQRVFLHVHLAEKGHGSPQGFFSAVQVKAKPESPVLDVLMGDADACIVSDVVLAAMSELNPRLKDKLKVLHASEPITRLPLFARKGLKTDDVRRLKEVLLKLHTSKKGKQLLLVFKKQQLAPVTDSDYDSVRRLFRRYDALTKITKNRVQPKGRRPGI